MTRDTDLIRRGDAIKAVTDADRDCRGAHGARENIAAIPAHPVQEPPGPGVTAGTAVENLVALIGQYGLFMGETWRSGDGAEIMDAYQAAYEEISTPVPVVSAEGLEDYDAGLLNDFGGGDVGWWQDYLRAEIGRANEFWREQVENVPALRSASPVGTRVKPLDAIFDAAKAEAEKAMRKFPQPNYVISKVAEEAGEVVKAAIHCAENRETQEAVLGEVVQCMAMLIRLCLEGDQVHGLAALLPAGEGE